MFYPVPGNYQGIFTSEDVSDTTKIKTRDDKGLDLGYVLIQMRRSDQIKKENS